MVGTIEPRIIAPNSSFNEFSWDSYSFPNLPPIHYPDGFQLPSRPVVLAPLAPRESTNQPGLAIQQHQDSYDGEAPSNQYGFVQNVINGVEPLPRLARATTSQSLRRILADEAEPAPIPPRKRQRKDEFVKLPQPEKKQKGSLQVAQPLVPPIIVGIVPPANQASKFRPIVDGGPFRDVHGRSSLNSAADEARRAQKGHIRTRTPPKEAQAIVDPTLSQEPLQDEPPVESTPRVVQQRNKWTEEETKQLLLGVKKHGIGNWKKILEDNEFTFNNRKAVHIKDRFRTCFPDGCDGPVAGTAASSGRKPLEDMEPSSAQDGTVAYQSVPATHTRPGAQPASKPPNGNHKKSKSHRKDLSDLQEIGIVQPFRKSERRARRAFTAEEDRNILLGFQKHGRSNWSAIQKDPELGLESRKPTDIRDRFRTRYPDKHRDPGEEKDGKEERQDALKSKGLRTVVSIEELLDHDVSASTQSQTCSQPQNPAHIHQQDAMQFLPSTSFPSYPDILSTSNRPPKMLSFTELLSDSGPLPAMDVPGDPFSFPEWNESTAFGGEEFWLPEIQTLLQPPAAVVSGAGRENTGRSAYDLSSICEAVDHPYGGQGLGG